MRPGPNRRAKRQQKYDAHRRAVKSVSGTARDRASWSSLSGAVLGSQARTRRIPAYEIRKARGGPAAEPQLVKAWRAYTGKSGRTARQAGLG
jgi:hypothetical protein